MTAPKRPKKEVDLTVFLLDYDGKIAVQQRENRGLLAGLWEFPNVEGHLPEQQALNLLADAQLSPRRLLCQVQRDHVFTHVIWHMRAYRIACGAPARSPGWSRRAFRRRFRSPRHFANSGNSFPINTEPGADRFPAVRAGSIYSSSG